MRILSKAFTRFLQAQVIDSDLVHERLITRREAAELAAAA
ncbi:hypothetical protein GCM10025866_18760 [Naasia aerilata]|uniref:Uncharacterized protein n=1 Tax=Naasia aerilata TaxID=1162966 RepID=A0ABM8GCJ4_9MICO|nr:hypothetical protein GCM10025866_18760 [Naasia aerilata]